MKSLFLIYTVIFSSFQFCIAQKKTTPLGVVKSKCDDMIYYDYLGERIYLTPSDDLLFGSMIRTGEFNIHNIISNSNCQGACRGYEDTTVANFVIRSYCNFKGKFASICYAELVHSPKGKYGTYLYNITFNCCALTRVNFVYLLEFRKYKTGKQKVLKFEYSYNEL